MKCPNCNQDLPDTAKACPACGMSFITDNNTNSIIKPEMIAAEKEINKIKKEDLKGVLILGIILCIIFAGITIYLKNFWGTIAFIFLGCLAVWGIKQQNKRISVLEDIKSGKKRYNLCPQCKSSNIEMNLVQTDSTTYLGRTTISDNINPLRPFTHTNINQGNISTANTYKNKCHCLDCGFVFDKPEIIYK